MNDNTRTIYTLTFPMPECPSATVTKEFDTWEERSAWLRSSKTTPINASMYRKPAPELNCMLPQCPGRYLMLLPQNPLGRIKSAVLHLVQ